MVQQTIGAPMTGMMNGIDLGLLTDSMAAVRADPGAGMLQFRVRTDWRGGTRMASRAASWRIGGEDRVRGHAIEADEPAELCGSNTAANPQELLMAAVNSCIMVGMVMECALRGIRLLSLRLECEGDLDLRGFFKLDPDIAPGYESVRLRVFAKAVASDGELRDAFAAAMRHSPNRWNITMPVGLEPELVIER